jgi:hypothetical protein
VRALHILSLTVVPIALGLWLGWFGIAILRGTSRVKSGIVAGLCFGAAVILIVVGVGVTALAISVGPNPW